MRTALAHPTLGTEQRQVCAACGAWDSWYTPVELVSERGVEHVGYFQLCTTCGHSPLSRGEGEFDPEAVAGTSAPFMMVCPRCERDQLRCTTITLTEQGRARAIGMWSVCTACAHSPMTQGPALGGD